MEYKVKRLNHVGTDCIVVTHKEVIILSYPIKSFTAMDIAEQLKPVFGDIYIDLSRLYFRR